MLAKVCRPRWDHNLFTIDIGYETSKSKQSAFPFTHNVTVDVISAAADKLWKEVTGNVKNLNVTAVQLAFTGIETTEAGQQSIEGFFPPKEARRPPLKRMRSSSEVVHPEGDPLQAMTEIPGSTSLTSFVCERCNKRISVDGSGMDWTAVDRATALTKLRMEHDDFHFAQDLANESDVRSPRTLKRKKVAEPKGIAKFFGRK